MLTLQGLCPTLPIQIMCTCNVYKFKKCTIFCPVFMRNLPSHCLLLAAITISVLHTAVCIILFDNIAFKCQCFDILGWWFDACGPSNLNGMYYQQGQNSNRFNGIKWYYWKGSGYSLKTTTMMIRPADFSGSL